MVKSDLKRAVGGGEGNHDGLVNDFSAGSFKTHRGKDAKRHSFLRLIEFGLFMNIVDKLIQRDGWKIPKDYPYRIRF